MQNYIRPKLLNIIYDGDKYTYVLKRVDHHGLQRIKTKPLRPSSLVVKRYHVISTKK